MDNIKVLVVDDNSRIVNLLKDAITKETDMDVIATAADGEEALKKIEIHNPDVVLLDLIMPRLDGLGVMERLKREEKNNFGSKDNCYFGCQPGKRNGKCVCTWCSILYFKAV